MKSKRQVLIIEDDQYLLEFYGSLEKTLVDEVELTIAKNGEEGIKALETKSFDALVLDLIMPVSDGYSLLNHLKDNPIESAVHITILTNLDTEEDREKTTKLGAQAYYVKADLSNRVLKEIILGSATE